MKIIKLEPEYFYGGSNYISSPDCPRGNEDGPDFCYDSDGSNILGEYCPYLKKMNTETMLGQCLGELKSIRFIKNIMVDKDG